MWYDISFWVKFLDLDTQLLDFLVLFLGKSNRGSQKILYDLLLNLHERHKAA